MDKENRSNNTKNNDKDNKALVCTNKQIVIYEYLNKAQNLMVNNSETLLSKFIYFAKSMEDMRKKWLESEARCRELEGQLKIEKSMCQRKINELKIDIETHYEKRLQAESKAERLQMDLDKMQDQFSMFSKILNDKHFDNEERLNMISNYNTQTYGRHHMDSQPDINCSRRLSRAIEDTGSIISDYTEDDIDVPNDDEDHYREHNQNMMINEEEFKYTTNACAPSTASLPNTTQNRRSTGTKRAPRHSASLTRNGEKREKKRTRTRSNDVLKDTSNQGERRNSEIKTITTVKLDDEGRPTGVTSEVQHGSTDLQVQSTNSQSSKDNNLVELTFVPPRVKNRKKRPSREFLQRSADESVSTEDSEIFWNGTDQIVDEISNTQTVPSNNLNIMTPIIEAPTPTANRNSHKGGQGTPALSKVMASQPKNFSTSSTLPLARKYKRSHQFKAQVILNSELCAHCDKRTKFGKMVMKCRECDLVVHTECKDVLQRPCYPAFNFPTQGKISDYVLGDSPQIPPILQMVINEIEHRGILTHEVGLYRVNGSDSQIKQLKEKLIKRHQVPDLRKISDVHVLCSFAKDFLNNLNEHLITYDTWYRFTKACEIINEVDRLSTLEEAIIDLPDANRDTLSFMILHLQRISETPECKMPISNLARVFGQSIVGNSSPNAPNVDIINEVRLQHNVVENLIRIPSSFYLSFIDGTGDQNHYRLFRNSAKTPEHMKKSRTAVVLSSILGPASNINSNYGTAWNQPQSNRK